MSKRTFGVAAVFLVGCAVGGASGQLVVPRASAQQAATVTAWEYNCQFAGEGRISDLANRLGADRWELTTVASHTEQDRNEYDVYCFRRPKL
jgi:hypothetical protein